MSICPHCNKPLVLNDPVEYNVLAYGVTALAVALCCGHGVRVRRIQNTAVSPYFGPDTEDDWLHKIKGKDIPCDTQ